MDGMGARVDWIYLTHIKDKRRAFLNNLIDLRFLWYGGEFFDQWENVSLSRRILLRGFTLDWSNNFVLYEVTV